MQQQPSPRPKRWIRARARQTWLIVGAIAMALSVLACSCDTRSSSTGQDGVLVFSYQTNDGDQTFQRPMAAGARLIISVRGADKQQVTAVNSAQATPADVLQVRTAGRAELELVAQRPGTATVEAAVTFKGQSGAQRDRFTFRVLEADRAALSHRCTNAPEAAYLVNSPVTLNYARFSGRERLVGGGACGVRLPSGLTQGVSCDESSFTIAPIAQAGPVELGAFARDRVSTVHVVSPEVVDFPPLRAQLFMDRQSEVQLSPQTAYWPLCTPLRLDVTILTPAHCAGSADRLNFQVEMDSQGLYRFSLVGYDPGVCVLQVTAPELGLGQVWEFSAPVSP